MVTESTGASLRLELLVEDVPLAVAFFNESLGFQVQSADQHDYVPIALGHVRITLLDATSLPAGHPLRGASGERQGLGVEIIIEVDDVDAAYTQARAASMPVSSDLQTRPWGLRDFRVVAPGGYYIRVTSR